MGEYIFNFEAIGTAKETAHGAYNRRGVEVFKARTAAQAVEMANEYFRPNKQFRFEYSFAGVVQTRPSPTIPKKVKS